MLCMPSIGIHPKHLHTKSMKNHEWLLSLQPHSSIPPPPGGLRPHPPPSWQVTWSAVTQAQMTASIEIRHISSYVWPHFQHSQCAIDRMQNILSANYTFCIHINCCERCCRLCVGGPTAHCMLSQSWQQCLYRQNITCFCYLQAWQSVSIYVTAGGKVRSPPPPFLTCHLNGCKAKGSLGPI